VRPKWTRLGARAHEPLLAVFMDVSVSSDANVSTAGPTRRAAVNMTDFDERRRWFLQTGGAAVVGGAAFAYAPGSGAQAGPHGAAMPARVSPAPPVDSKIYKRFKLKLRVFQHELVPGIVVHMMGYQGQVPAPTIRVTEGDWVWVDFENVNDEMHTIHWHGLIVPYRMDGVPYLTQDPVMRGESYQYVFQARPYGTHFYHCHFGTNLHMQAGMYGAFIVERPGDPIRDRFPYTGDHVLILSSVDTVFVRDQLNAMFARMRQRDAAATGSGLDLASQARYHDLAALRADVAAGNAPAYARSRTTLQMPQPNFFTINGKSYPATEPIKVREGEWTRIRFINAGNVPFAMHLHGHDFYHVCTDGAPLPEPVRMSTIPIAPGRTEDIVFLADNPGLWALHDHDVTHTTNNGLYPGGAMTDIEYEGFKSDYEPTVSLDE
jgi:FtsP/CotA-like multicopper oxidase with cupredoxin domain